MPAPPIGNEPQKIFKIQISGDCNFEVAGEGVIAYQVAAGFVSGAGPGGFFRFSSKDASRAIGVVGLIKQFLPTGISIGEVPDFIDSLKIIAFNIEYIGGNTGQFIFSFETAIDINGSNISATVSYNSTKTAGGGASAFKAILHVDKEHHFELAFNKNEARTSYLAASYLKSGSTRIDFRNIAGKLFSADVAAQAPDLTIQLADFKAFFVYRKPEEPSLNKGMMLGMGAGLGLAFSLKDLPMAGEILGSGTDFKIEDIIALYSSGAFTQAELKALKNNTLPTQAIGSGFNLAARIKAGDKTSEILLGDLVSAPPLEDTANTGTSGAGDKATQKKADVIPVGDPDTKWLDVKKKLGPVDLQRVGFRYKDGKVVFLMDAALSISVLSIQLLGLGFGFKLKWPPDMPPEFFLTGLGIAYKSGPVEISGMLVRIEKENELEFIGLVYVKLKAFTIAGIGAYSKLKIYPPGAAAQMAAVLAERNSKAPATNEYKQLDARYNTLKATYQEQVSFFIYAVYSGPIGGPAFFFVTGIAIGFGYNRRVRTPKIEEVRDFPLVALALNPDPDKKPTDILTELISKNWIPSSPGDYWMAVGIKFTSFKLIESFVLLIVQFGTRFEVAILGLSVLKWPDIANPIAYVELAILVRFASDSDVISVQAMITPNSYILDKNCKISGGFAFFMWVSGPNEGDFVISLGGYHPDFKKPAHYPDVDRLALRWKISNIVSISGELYYALTPKAIMAGGKWEVSCDLSFLKASVTIWANMFVSWAPVYYSLTAGIIVRIEANIKILFVYIHFKLEMGAEVKIWGPPFAGHVHVNWSIFSFTIPFGSTNTAKSPALLWDQFSSTFIPKKDGKDLPLDVRLTAGIINIIKNGSGEVVATLVNPYDLAIAADSFFPLTAIYTQPGNAGALDGKTLMQVAGTDAPTYLEKRNDAVGIKPMELTALETELSVWLEKAGAASDAKTAVIAKAKGMASALWANKPDEKADILKNVLTGIELHTVEDKDDTIIEIPLNEHNKQEVSKDILYVTNSNAGNTLEPEKIVQEIQEGISKTTRKDVAAFFNAAGFKLPDTGTLTYADLQIDTPLYLAAIGQKIPSMKNDD